ncbi:hypothetical protein BGZ47_000801 [Haplosporangium gracile]|nr:hypothetical protein BGZ47_000801 [Haplosporangium gracile]
MPKHQIHSSIKSQARKLQADTQKLNAHTLELKNHTHEWEDRILDRIIERVHKLRVPKPVFRSLYVLDLCKDLPKSTVRNVGGHNYTMSQVNSTHWTPYLQAEQQVPIYLDGRGFTDRLSLRSHKVTVKVEYRYEETKDLVVVVWNDEDKPNISHFMGEIKQRFVPPLLMHKATVEGYMSRCCFQESHRIFSTRDRVVSCSRPDSNDLDVEKVFGFVVKIDDPMDGNEDDEFAFFEAHYDNDDY